MQLTLEQPGLFIRKTVTVILASLALIPLAGGRGDLPVSLYLGALVVLHLFILGLYVYRVQVRTLDPDWRSLTARVLALGVVVYLLAAVSGFDAASSTRSLLFQAAWMAGLHTIVLALLMVRIRYEDLAPPSMAERAVASSD